ncbi:hypothetical protein QQF64_010579 [Cirrhinus molitorella]|uniref:Secreted protein n=1 Tax=Cirrhinus molitorella TaxID=172907 RepID=A0ABR3LYG7_9TELE
MIFAALQLITERLTSAIIAADSVFTLRANDDSECLRLKEIVTFGSHLCNDKSDTQHTLLFISVFFTVADDERSADRTGGFRCFCLIGSDHF